MAKPTQRGKKVSAQRTRATSETRATGRTRATGGTRATSGARATAAATRSTNIPGVPHLNIKGPFWSAEIETLQVVDPQKNWTFRSLFLDLTPRRLVGDENFFLLPGTMLVLCCVKTVRVQPAAGHGPVYTWERAGSFDIPSDPTLAQWREYLRSGQLSLLLLQAEPAAWPETAPGPAPEMTCLAGDINLEVLTPQNDTVARLYRVLELSPADPGEREGAARLPGAISVHASGLSLYGAAQLPWEAEPFVASFQLARLLPDPFIPSEEEHAPGYRLTVEVERLTAHERGHLQNAWKRLSAYLNPRNPQNDAELLRDDPAPRWATLEIADLTEVPRLYWQIAPWQEEPELLPLLFEPGAFNLILSDQQPYDETHPPTSLARIVPKVALMPGAGNTLEVTLTAGDAAAATSKKLNYLAELTSVWQETLALADLEVAFNPVETPRFLRDRQALPEPQWAAGAEATPVAPGLLWAFMPLEDGWAQLPVPNLTEQIYLDAELANSAAQNAEAPALLQGAVSIGNEQTDTLAFHGNEQPWSVTLTDAERVLGRWELHANAGGSFTLTRITLELFAPEVILNGFLWLSTGKPSIQDALPNFDDWIAGLQSPALKTIAPETDLFPGLVTFAIAQLALTPRTSLTPQNQKLLSADLRGWEFFYGVDEEVFRKMIAARVLSKDLFKTHLPLIWRRHASLPMVQTLPLTQSQTPPNYPSASRQLVPFELPVTNGTASALALPKDWRFGTPASNGAAAWPVLLGTAQPGREWCDKNDLPLAALSLPGLILDPTIDPSRTGLAPGAEDLLPAQLRFDLPYTDELNALAQLPKVTRKAEEVSPLPATPPPQPAQPLTRETFSAHWQRLSERASLASADAVHVFAKPENETVVEHLIEPLLWPVQPNLELQQYPGRLSFNATMALEKESALAGLSGKFAEESNGKLRALAEGETHENPFEVMAGSMSAHRDAEGRFRDQRGLLRAAARMGTNLVQTPVRLHEEAAGYELTSSLQSFTLQVSAQTQWQFWFRDLPVQAGTFTRTVSTRSAELDLDVNDPEAMARERNFLSGYEWRLAGSAANALTLFNLHFYPLTLEKAVCGEDRLEQIELIGRLQLPVPGTAEHEEISNAVRVTFKYDASTNQLAFAALALETEEGTWPLALQNNETGAAPCLSWQRIRFDAEVQRIFVEQVRLRFFLFGAEWSIPAAPLAFAPQPMNVQQYALFSQFEASEPLAPTRLNLNLDLASGNYTHNASLQLAIRLGQSARRAFVGEARFELLENRAEMLSASLFEDLVLAREADFFEFSADENALQFTWKRFEQAPQLQLLPGLDLGSQQAPGFAALTFTLAPFQPGLPRFVLQTGFLETLLHCRSGEFLQARAKAQDERLQVFGSSAADLVCGYTAQWQSPQWRENFLLNGFLEVKNLLSWPAALGIDEAQKRLTLPPARVEGAMPALHHVRHSIRILFNQHEIPPEKFRLSAGPILFQLADNEAWQFLAVAEHQLIEIIPDQAFSSLTLQHDRRWTALQEVRLILPQTFKQFLAEHRLEALRTLDPVAGTNWIGDANFGYLRAQLRTELEKAGFDPELDKLPANTLLVEASAPHWIRRTPLQVDAAATLQFLPNGSQHAILSTPADYSPSDPHAPDWMLLTMPFLGRLQERSNDGLDPSAPGVQALSVLQRDPILHMYARRAAAPNDALPSRALALTCWGDNVGVEISVSGMDWLMGRTWPRLDPLTLEENWYRLQNPLNEPLPERLQSVLASFIESPARLSRPLALRRAFDVFRREYPPAPIAIADLPATPSGNRPEWRQNNLMAWQAVSDLDVYHQPPYGWPIVGLHILTSGLLQEVTALTGVPQRYAAATVLPAALESEERENPVPVSFAVSPYVGLEFKTESAAQKLALLSAELLCLEKKSGALRPVASQLAEAQGRSREELVTLLMPWSAATQQRLSPESPLAVLRFREINSNVNAAPFEAVVTATYSFSLALQPQAANRLGRRVLQLRSPVAALRFREGTFGGNEMPQNLKPFELAPPQAHGVQPLYLNERPAALANGKWPWGLSALRTSVQFTQAQAAVIGSLGVCAQESAMTLWWIATQHAVQFRSALHSSLPAASLPKKFRGRAIKSLLPVLPNPALPFLRTRFFFQTRDSQAPVAAFRAELNCKIQRWQPILPGALRYLLLGARAGVMLAARPQILRQSLLKDNLSAPQNGSALVSGSVPIQHRTPRPVPLPPNTEREFALQTWASYFDIAKGLLLTSSPSDEAFLAACDGRPAVRLLLQLLAPAAGAIPSLWNGDLQFVARPDAEAPGFANDWEVRLEINEGEEKFLYDPQTVSSAGAYEFHLPEEAQARLQLGLSLKRGGDSLLVHARVSFKPAADGFYQTLTFPLRVRAETALPLPLVPAFAHFEDPEYNRRLASSSAHAGVIVNVEESGQLVAHTVTLASDRKEYNFDSRVALRFDWDDERATTGSLELERLDANNIITPLTLAEADFDLGAFAPGKLVQFSLFPLRRRDTGETVRLQSGEAVQFKLTVAGTAIYLQAGIVDEPVNPVPQAAYALLRERKAAAQRQVECVRFAWSPQPSRIELVCPEDLRTEIVRRRAVFQWSDTARPQSVKKYEVQKIAANGATHFPPLVED